ncbi:hypothetical protein T265_01629 [Opisthorchis viverrini]|uniref:Peptidase A1 domain-containing protein n=1 Tax=Opisthorchis viverrini TaxID=6198 RepID=A0A075AIT5_OPIVI|nr:hypothetical protein T265_01629 [Opisthorchis viverrini]KER32194.1 hypothetical protein T265_01629 [Opisthorchis viverrini]
MKYHKFPRQSRETSTKKVFAAELLIRKCQLNSYRLLGREASCLQKLNIHLLLERVFLNFPGYSLNIAQIQANVTKRLHKFRNRYPFSRNATRVYTKETYYLYATPIGSITVTQVLGVQCALERFYEDFGNAIAACHLGTHRNENECASPKKAYTLVLLSDEAVSYEVRKYILHKGYAVGTLQIGTQQFMIMFDTGGFSRWLASTVLPMGCYKRKLKYDVNSLTRIPLGRTHVSGYFDGIQRGNIVTDNLVLGDCLIPGFPFAEIVETSCQVMPGEYFDGIFGMRKSLPGAEHDAFPETFLDYATRYGVAQEKLFTFRFCGQLNVLHQAALCFSGYDTRDIALHAYT